MALIEYTAPAKTLPYLEAAQALLDATSTNPNAADEIIVDVADAGKTQFNYQQAAISLGFTASVAVSEEVTPKKGEEVSHWRFVFRAKPKRKSGPRAPRTRKGGTVASADAIDAPTV